MEPAKQLHILTVHIWEEFIDHARLVPGFQSVADYQLQDSATIIVLANLDFDPDGSPAATQLKKVILPSSLPQATDFLAGR